MEIVFKIYQGTEILGEEFLTQAPNFGIPTPFLISSNKTIDSNYKMMKVMDL